MIKEFPEEFTNISLERNVLKTLEELSELQVELIQKFTKGKENKFNEELVAGEITDVYIQISLLVKQLQIEDLVSELVPQKIAKGVNNLKTYGLPKIDFK